jgi:hypothetical protein
MLLPLAYSLAFCFSFFIFLWSFLSVFPSFSFSFYLLDFPLVGIHGNLGYTKRLAAIFRLACALQKAHGGGIRVSIEGQTYDKGA